MRLWALYKNILIRYSSGKIVLSLLIATWIVYGYMIFFSIPAVMEYSEEMKLLDMQPFGYSYNYVHDLLDKLGNDGREKYLTGQIPIDMIYPLLFAICYSLLLYFLFKTSGKNGNKVFIFCLIPIMAGLFDYLENIGIIFLITDYPDISSLQTNTTCFFTIGKSLFTTLFWLLLLYGLISIVVRRIKKS